MKVRFNIKPQAFEDFLKGLPVEFRPTSTTEFSVNIEGDLEEITIWFQERDHGILTDSNKSMVQKNGNAG
jgi:hypothetical protein